MKWLMTDQIWKNWMHITFSLMELLILSGDPYIVDGFSSVSKLSTPIWLGLF